MQCVRLVAAAGGDLMCRDFAERIGAGGKCPGRLQPGSGLLFCVVVCLFRGIGIGAGVGAAL